MCDWVRVGLLCGYVGQTTAVKPRAFSGQSFRGDGHWDLVMNELVLTPLKQKLCCVSMEYRLKSVKAEDTFNRDQAQEFNCLTLVRACAQAFNSPLPGTITQAWMSKVCAHMCTYMQVCIHVCGAAISQRSMLGIFLSFSAPCFLRQRHSLSLNLGVTHSTRLTG